MQLAIPSRMSFFPQPFALAGMVVLFSVSYALAFADELSTVAECPASRGTGSAIAPECATKQDKLAANSTTTALKTDSLASPQGTGPAGFGSKWPGAILVSDLLGQPMFSMDGKHFGKVDDVVLMRNLESVVAVIGVGGFLGFGGKNIAIPADRINIAVDDDGEIKLSIASTWEQLQASPSFDRTALMR